MSSRGSASFRSPSRRRCASSSSSWQLLAAGERSVELGDRELPLGRLGVGEAVGVEDEPVAAAQPHRLLGAGLLADAPCAASGWCAPTSRAVPLRETSRGSGWPAEAIVIRRAERGRRMTASTSVQIASSPPWARSASRRRSSSAAGTRLVQGQRPQHVPDQRRSSSPPPGPCRRRRRRRARASRRPRRRRRSLRRREAGSRRGGRRPRGRAGRAPAARPASGCARGCR